jgi:hypothetical protein
MNRKWIFWTGSIGVALFIITTILAGLQFSDYSHISQFISESYAIDTPYGVPLRFLGFLPSGVLLTAFAFFAIPHFNKSTSIKLGFWGLGIFYGIATILVSIFPCDKGCNKELIDPSISQLIHNLTGLLTYLFVPLSLVLIGWGMRQDPKLKSIAYTAIGAGLICWLFIGILLSNPLTEYAGLFQRCIEGTILAWIGWCSIQILKGKTLNHSIS